MWFLKLFIISFKYSQICYNRTRKLNKTEGYTLPLYVYIKEGYTLPLYVYIKEGSMRRCAKICSLLAVTSLTI